MRAVPGGVDRVVDRDGGSGTGPWCRPWREWLAKSDNDPASVMHSSLDVATRRVCSFPTVVYIICHAGNVARGSRSWLWTWRHRAHTDFSMQPSYLHLLVLDQSLSSRIIPENSPDSTAPVPSPRRLDSKSPRPRTSPSSPLHHLLDDTTQHACQRMDTYPRGCLGVLRDRRRDGSDGGAGQAEQRALWGEQYVVSRRYLASQKCLRAILT
jgi:hypothetical protein